MEDQDRILLIATIVEKVFIPDVMVQLNGFVVSLKNQIINTHEYKQITGYDVVQAPVTLDLRTAQTRLVESLAIALRETK